MKKPLAILVVFNLLAGQAFPWGRKAHSVIGDIAGSRLEPVTRKNVQLLLGNETLASIASWADEVRSERDESYGWHFVNIPRDADGFSEARDCYQSAGSHRGAQSDPHNCVVDRIEIFEKELMDPNAPREQRAEALKWLVHFVGDIHQPLHAIGDARGGNDLKVTVFGSPRCGESQCNLHWTWDELLVQHTGWPEPEYVHHMKELIKVQRLANLPVGTPAEWANESHREARAIMEKAPAAIDQKYYQANIELVNRRLALAGVRLAELLNASLGKVSTQQLKEQLTKQSGESRTH